MVHAGLPGALKLREGGNDERSRADANYFQCGGQVFRVTGSASMRRIQALSEGDAKSAAVSPGFRLAIRSTSAT